MIFDKLIVHALTAFSNSVGLKHFMTVKHEKITINQFKNKENKCNTH